MVTVFQLWLLLALSDAIAGALAARYLWLLEGGFARKKALLMAAVSLESAFVFLSLWLEPQYVADCVSVSALTLRLTGRSLKCAAVWWITFYDLGLFKSGGGTVKG